MAPNGTVKRFTMWPTPSLGSAKARLGASTMASPCAASLCISARNSGPLVSCGSGKLVTITATMATGTISASTAAMASALPDQVSERMPPSTTDAMKAATSRTIIIALRLPGEPAGGEGAHAELGGEHQQRRHGEQGGRQQPHGFALEAAAEIARHGEGAELAEERRQHHRHDDEAGEAADHQAQRVEADKEEHAGDGDHAGGAQRSNADAKPGVARRHAPSGGEELERLLRRRAQPDGDVEHQRPEQHRPAQVWNRTCRAARRSAAASPARPARSRKCRSRCRAAD